MTNQETIANLNMISVAFVEPVTKDQRKLIDDTFDNAIKALEQEPCDKCEVGNPCLYCKHEFETYGKERCGMTKVYELPNGHRMVADVDESTRVCNITETTLDSLVSKLNYYAEQAEVLDKIRAEIDIARFIYKDTRIAKNALDGGLKLAMQIIDKYAGKENE